jgi:mannose-6-phosphate isomerase-like protein (cupin superfamily)
VTQLDSELFVAPEGEQDRAGLRGWQPPKNAYERFMEEEGVPVHRGIIGVHNIRELDLAPWPRLGGNGAFIYLDSLQGIKGMYVLELPHGGTTNPERHLYHEFYLVFEGYGVTETWTDSESDKRTFEWGPGSLFYFPPNVNHRLINSGTDRVLILATTNAPPLYNMLRDRTFIFANDYLFPLHYTDDDQFWKSDEKLYRVPGNKRAQARTNFFSDIINVDLPLDNQRVPGYRRIQPGFRGFEEDHNGFVSQYPIGRYSRGHHHAAGAVLVCLSGGGYTFNWPREYGITPWKDGHADKVKVLEYEQGGLVAAAPGGGTWFHQHFPVSRKPFRVINYWGGPSPVPNDSLNHATGKSSNLNIEEGGSSIGYSREDPYVRELFESRLTALGMRSNMPPELYEKD